MDQDQFALPLLQHHQSLDLSSLLESQPPNYEDVLRSTSSGTTNSSSGDDSSNTILSDDNIFDLPNEPLAPFFAPSNSAGKEVDYSLDFSSQPAPLPHNQQLQQLASYIHPSYNYQAPAATDSSNQLVPYSSSSASASFHSSSHSTSSFSSGSHDVVPASRRTGGRSKPRGGSSKEERQIKRKEQHAATDKQRRQTLAVLNTQLKDLICSMGSVDGGTKVEQTLVLEEAIRLIQQMKLQQDYPTRPRTKMLKMYHTPELSSCTGLQAIYDTLKVAYSHCYDHVMQYEVCFSQDPHFVATPASEALHRMGGVGFTTNAAYTLQDMFNSDWLETPQSAAWIREQMPGRKLIDPPFASSIPRLLNEYELPIINGDKQGWSEFLWSSPPQTLLYAVVQHTNGQGQRWESIIAIGWVQPVGRPGRKLMVSAREASRLLSIPAYGKYIDSSNLEETSGRTSPTTPPPTAHYNASFVDSTDTSSLSSSSSVAEYPADDASVFQGDFPTFVGA